MARKDQERKRKEEFQKAKRMSDYQLKKLAEIKFDPIIQEVNKNKHEWTKNQLWIWKQTWIETNKHEWIENKHEWIKTWIENKQT